MKTLNYKSASVKSYAMTVALFITMSLATQSVFSQEIVGAKKITNMSENNSDMSRGGDITRDEELYEVYNYGDGRKEYKWRVSYDISDWGIWSHDFWTPMGSYGHLQHLELQKVGYDAVFSTLTVTYSFGYGNLYPGLHQVQLNCTDESVNILTGSISKLDYTASHLYRVN